MRDLLVGLGLVLVIEGLLWAAFPGTARRMLEVASVTPESVMRLTALVIAAVGVAVIAFARAA